jgi:ribose/xylose/arabinose/galactoside ABC-type transport system permease subunit
MSESGATLAAEPSPSGPPTPVVRGAAQRALGNLLLAARFLPVWIATGLLFIVALIMANDSVLNSAFWGFVLPYMTVLAVAALGQMLVIMQGGIDLSTPGVMFLGGNLILGVSHHSDSRLALGILACIGLGLLVGLANGLLVGVLRLNPLIVTLAVGTIVLAFGARYARSVSFESAVPPALKSWTLTKPLGISWTFWTGVLLTIFVALLLRYTVAGRRFQAVGANPQAAWMSGIHVRGNIVCAYALAGGLYGAAAILLAGVRGSIDFAFGTDYLLAPIAAVVIAGASLAGGLASVTSTWVAAFALTLLGQLLLVLGLSQAMQFVVFGAAILAGMIVSGDRIAAGLGKLLQHPRTRALFGEEQASST